MARVAEEKITENLLADAIAGEAELGREKTCRVAAIAINKLIAPMDARAIIVAENAMEKAKTAIAATALASISFAGVIRSSSEIGNVLGLSPI